MEKGLFKKKKKKTLYRGTGLFDIIEGWCSTSGGTNDLIMPRRGWGRGEGGVSQKHFLSNLSIVNQNIFPNHGGI